MVVSVNKRKFLTGFLVAALVFVACVAFAADVEPYNTKNLTDAVKFLSGQLNGESITYADNWVASVDADEVYARRFGYDGNTGETVTDATQWEIQGGVLGVDLNGTFTAFDLAFFRGGQGLNDKIVAVSADSDAAMTFVKGLDNSGFEFDAPDATFIATGVSTDDLGTIIFAPCCKKLDWCCLDVNEDTLFVAETSADLGPLSADSSPDVMVYIPCYEAEKRWQITPYDKRVHFEDMVLVNPAQLKEVDRHSTDLCKISYLGNTVETLFSNHYLYVGPYVVESVLDDPHWAYNEDVISADKLYENWVQVASSDFLAERVLNFSPYGLLPRTNTSDFHWRAIVETSVDIAVAQIAANEAQVLAEVCDEPVWTKFNQKYPASPSSTITPDEWPSFLLASDDVPSSLAFRARRIEDGVESIGTFAQYFLYEDDLLTDTAAKHTHTGWLSYLENDPQFALSPGFAQYLAVFPEYDGCVWNDTFASPQLPGDLDGQASRYHMFYRLKDRFGDYGDFCEFTEITYRRWNEQPVCAQICEDDQFFDDDECWIYTPMSVDAATWVEVQAAASEIDWDDVDTFGLASEDCDYVCGGTLGWFHNEESNKIKEKLAAIGDPGDVCLETEFGLQLTDFRNCNPADGVLPIKVEFLLRKDQVCCDTAEIEDILDRLGAHRICGENNQDVYVDDRGREWTMDQINEIANLGPVDAFLSKSGVDRLQVLFMAEDGSLFNLVDLAEEYAFPFNGDHEKADFPWLGVKNFFRVWPQTLSDKTPKPVREMLSVKEAWRNNEQLEFSFYAVFVDETPDDGQWVKASNGYFVIYTGEPNGSDKLLDARVAVACGYGGSQPTPEPKDPEILSITSDPQGTETDADCASDDELTEDSFSDAAWTEILKALNISADDEGDYEYTVTCKDCDDYVVSLDAGLSLDVKVTYEEGEPAPAAGTYRSVFVKDVVNSLYDVLAAEELTIAVEKDVQGVIYEGGAYDADASGDTLKAGFCLLEVVATPKTVTPTTTPSSGGGSGCSFGFAPLALLLLAPLALLKK